MCGCVRRRVRMCVSMYMTVIGLPGAVTVSSCYSSWWPRVTQHMNKYTQTHRHDKHHHNALTQQQTHRQSHKHTHTQKNTHKYPGSQADTHTQILRHTPHTHKHPYTI
eukprot:GHVQ01017530.1.p1 GENE.GHVQ01017530.1~~GHVQ01017530.1.p1  ORF type:complete len:108 (-),score=28.54 GHVQ01017530.1:445-768(-)